jgi:hypothetical protein
MGVVAAAAAAAVQGTNGSSQLSRQVLGVPVSQAALTIYSGGCTAACAQARTEASVPADRSADAAAALVRMAEGDKQ